MKYEFQIQLPPLKPEKRYGQALHGFECALWATGEAALSFWTDDEGMENCEAYIESLNIETEFTCAGERIEALCQTIENATRVYPGGNSLAPLESLIIAAYYDAKDEETAREGLEMRRDLAERAGLGLPTYDPDDFVGIRKVTIFEPNM